MLIRQSGRPASEEKAAAFEADWKLAYDKCEAKADAVFAKTTGKLTLTPRMIVLQRLCRYVERALTLKHGSEDFVAMPQSALAWNKLITSYGDTPILVAKRTDKGLVLILMDQLGG